MSTSTCIGYVKYKNMSSATIIDMCNRLPPCNNLVPKKHLDVGVLTGMKVLVSYKHKLDSCVMPYGKLAYACTAA